MNSRTRVFLLGLAVTFGLPWLFMVVIPFIKVKELAPVPYAEEADGQTGFFPPAKAGIAAAGLRVYLSEGCVTCHTQIVRPTYAGIDGWKKPWRIADRSGAVRYSLPHDYAGLNYAPLGDSRIGPDLANVGYRINDRAWHYLHLYNPRHINPWSNMPSFRHLFEKRAITGQPSDSAIQFPEGEGPGEGYEVVPTSAARDLVGYLLSLKQEQKVPAALGAGGSRPAKESPGSSGSADPKAKS